MKNILGDASGHCGRVISNFVRRLKRAFVRFRALFFKPAHQGGRQTGQRVPAAATGYSPKTSPWYRNKKAVLAGGLVLVAAAVVLAFALPKPSEEALASVGDGLRAAAAAEPSGASDTLMSAMGAGAADVAVTEDDATETSETPDTVMAASPTPIPTTAPDEAPLVPGVHDARILDVQSRLMELDYLDNDEPTDYYGTGTKYALQLFQRKNSLQVDGLIGEQTLRSLFSNDALPYTVKIGDRGSDVKAMQERLKELNYLKAKATGVFGTDTETAVKSFQKRNGLSADGNVGEFTREVLYSEDAKAAKATNGGSNNGGGHGGGTTIAVGNPDEASVEKLIEIAKSKLGCEYTRAAKGPNEFDCSGFVYYCLNTAGYKIGYMTSKGWGNCGLPKVTSMSDMKKGDIICFKGHVGIYLGGGDMIDAGSSTDNVRICKNITSSAYWKRVFICARRVF